MALLEMSHVSLHYCQYDRAKVKELGRPAVVSCSLACRQVDVFTTVLLHYPQQEFYGKAQTMAGMDVELTGAHRLLSL